MTVCCPTCGSSVERIDPAKAVAVSHLSDREWRLATALLSRFGRYVSTRDLACAVWPDTNGGPMTAEIMVGQLVGRCRTKLVAVGLTIEAQNGRAGRRLTWAKGGAG